MNHFLKEKIKKFPLSSGVYLFIGSKGDVLYVGRAVSLKKRVANYFQKNQEPRIAEMVSLAKRLEFRETENLLEAVILEANLIKKFWPKYNVKDKDNRSFVYFVIPKKEDFPRPFIVRQREIGKFPMEDVHVFGPYQSFSILQSALKIIRRVFPYSTCRYVGKPCFNRQISLCAGVCSGEISREDYGEIIRNIVLLLSGNRKRLLKKLQKENPAKAKALSHLQDVSLISQENKGVSEAVLNRIEGYDISHLTGKESYGSMVVFSNGKSDKTEYRLFKIKNAPESDDLRALEEMLSRRLNHDEWPLPDLIMVDGGRPQIDFIVKLFKRKNISVPLIGISKFGGDQLVFPAKTKKSLRELAESIKPTLLAVRDEAHRFGLRASRRKRKLKT